MRLILSALILFGLNWPVALMGWKNSDVIEKSAKGVINWSQGTVQATSELTCKIGSFQNKRPFSADGNTLKDELFDKIFTTAQSLRIDNTVNVRDFVIETDAYFSKLKDFVSDAQIVWRTDTKNHITRATARMSIYGGFAQLVLPQGVKQVQTIQLIVPVEDDPDKPRGPSETAEFGIARPYTGLIVDARNIKAIPALVPVIYDEKGNEVYGPAFVSREFAVQYGLAGYSHSIETALDHVRVTDNPMVVKGLRLHPSGPCNIVISNADAARIHNTHAHLSFLRECHVMIVLD